MKLPDKILPIPCSDKKKWREKWHNGRNMLNIPHSFRLLAIGPPDSGKTTLIKNIILRADPPFKKILVYHFSDTTSEWSDIDGKKIKDLDPLAYEGNNDKTIIIIDDCNFKNANKDLKYKINRLFGYTSSHCNVSICITAQNPYDISPEIRRMANLICLWKNHDMNSLKTLASRTGLKAKQIEFIMIYLLKNPHDFLMIDLQANSPAIYRINGYTKLDLNKLDEAIKKLK